MTTGSFVAASTIEASCGVDGRSVFTAAYTYTGAAAQTRRVPMTGLAPVKYDNVDVVLTGLDLYVNNILAAADVVTVTLGQAGVPTIARLAVDASPSTAHTPWSGKAVVATIEQPAPTYLLYVNTASDRQYNITLVLYGYTQGPYVPPAVVAPAHVIVDSIEEYPWKRG